MVCPVLLRKIGRRVVWPFKKKEKEQWKGTLLRNELLYVMAKLELIPDWLDMGNGLKMGVGMATPRIMDKHDANWFPK